MQSSKQENVFTVFYLQKHRVNWLTSAREVLEYSVLISHLCSTSSRILDQPICRKIAGRELADNSTLKMEEEKNIPD